MNELKLMSENKKSTFLYINTKTWDKDSHGLFDYQVNTNYEDSFTVRTDTHLTRTGTKVKEIRDNFYYKLAEFEFLCNINLKNSN